MKVHLISAKQLTAEQFEAWTRIQQSNPMLASPFFRPEFTRAVGLARDDVEVAILYGADDVVGIFPFHRDQTNVGWPVGLRLSDFHGLIAREDVQIDPWSLLEQCNLAAWRFNHLPASQLPFEDFQWGTAESPYIDLHDGFDRYCRGHREAGGRLVPQIQRKARKLERERGCVRFTFRTMDQGAFELLRAWKSAQRDRTATFDVLRLPWVISLIDHLRRTEGTDFEAILSMLSLNDEIIAAHLGLRSRHVLHVWFPAFDRRYEKYSPGLVLLLELLRAAAADGIERVDLGKGPERYKESLKTGAVRLGEGAVDRRVFARLLGRGWYGTKQWVRASPFSGAAEVSKRFARQVQRWMSSPASGQ